MSDQFIETFVDKLILLEQKVGAKASYRVMPPLPTPFYDCLAIQMVAKQIAEFIGLEGFTFVVAISKQKDNVAGHIDVSSRGKEVFIEISNDILKFPDTVDATLCHEICHKWLQINGIYSPLEVENEILTDITSVFLGFGKIMLNGCMSSFTREEPISNGTRTITETITAGYLKRNQLALVYCLVCAMRHISGTDLMNGLNSEAALEVETCNSRLGHHYAARFHAIEATQEILNKFTNLLFETHYTMAELDKHVTYIKKSLCENMEDFLIAQHNKLDSLRQKTIEMTQEAIHDPALRFLQAVRSEFEIKRFINETDSVLKDANGFLRHTNTVAHYISTQHKHFQPPPSIMFNIITCPKDGTKLRLPENTGGLIATCPKCKYRFGYNTTIPLFSEPAAVSELSWWRKFINLIKGKQKNSAS